MCFHFLQGITATGALAYDAITVLEAGFKSILQQIPGIFRTGRNKRPKGVSCEMAGEERQHTLWEHGPEIAKALKNVQIDGLTGVIRYNFLIFTILWSFFAHLPSVEVYIPIYP